MAIVAMIIVAVLIFLLTGQKNIFTRTFQLRTFMADSAGMAEGATVRLNGIPVGDVEALKLSGSPDPNRIVEVDMEINSRYLTEIPKDSRAGIAAANLLGEKFVNISRGTSRDHVDRGDEIRSVPNQDIPELVAESTNLLGQFQSLLTRVDMLVKDVEAGKGNIGKLLKDEELYTRLISTLADAQAILTAVRTGKGTISRLLFEDTLYQEIRGPIEKLDAIMGELQQGRGTAGKFLKDEALYNDLKDTTAQAHQLLADLQRGKGTAGKLLKDEALYDKVNQFMTKVDNTISRVNSGQGTLGQLMVNPQLYESLNGATGELHQLLKDMRANPKKFLRIKLAIF